MDIKPDALFTNPVLAAALGSVLALKAIPGTSTGEKLLNVVLSFVLGIYGGPALAEIAGVTSQRLEAAIIVLSAGAGLVAFAALLEAIKETRFADFLPKWLGRKE